MKVTLLTLFICMFCSCTNSDPQSRNTEPPLERGPCVGDSIEQEKFDDAGNVYYIKVPCDSLGYPK